MRTETEKMVEEVPGVDRELAEVVEAVREERSLREHFGIDPAAIDSILENAFALHQRDELDRARTLLEGVRALDETFGYPHLLLGDIYHRAGELDRALESFERATERMDEVEEASLRAAQVQLELGDEAEARERLERLAEDAAVSDGIRERAEALLQNAAPPSADDG